MNPTPFLDAVARTNSATLVTAAGRNTRMGYSGIWQAVSRSMTPENVALVKAFASLGAALFPLQMSIFDAFSRVGRDMQLQGHVRAEDLLAIGRQHRTSILPVPSVPANETIEDSTADSWRVKVPREEVAGEEGWLQRATEEVSKAYGEDVLVAIPSLRHLKVSLCEAMEKVNNAEQRVLQLQFVRADAAKHRDNVRKVLLANDRAAETVQESASLAVHALEDLASKSDGQLESAKSEAVTCRQQLYVLQLGWTSAVGGASLLPLCGICLQKPVEVACVPCGHTYCQDCASKIGKQRVSQYAPLVPCHVCRAVVKHKQKVFFS